MSANPETVADDMVTIEIDGVETKAPKGSMIIHATDEANVYVPRFCYHKKLPIAANCRMCLVEVEGVPKPLPACATPVMDGMKVKTRSTFAKNAQKAVMEFLLINHPLDCPICDQGGECELQDIAMGYGGSISRFTEKKRILLDKDIGPLVTTEMTRCILCTRCIRTMEVLGDKELGGMGRGSRTTIGTYIEGSIDSEMSGNVIDVCPVGALTAKPSRFAARAWEMRSNPTIAAHDCVGSNLNIHTSDKRVVRAVPRENESINEVWISDRDRYAYEGLNSEQRLSSPMIKVNGEWQETDWNTALDEVVNALGARRDSLAALCSPNATVEEAYLLQRLMRDLGSDNIDHRIGQQDFSDDGRAPLVQAMSCKIDALEDIDTALIIGSNTRHDQPIVSHRLRKAANNGAQLMLLNHVDYDFNYPIAEKIIASPSAITRELAGIVKAMLEISTEQTPTGIPALIDTIAVTDTHRNIADKLKVGQKVAIIVGMQAMALPELAAIRCMTTILAEQCDATINYLPRGANSSGASLAGAVPFASVGGKSQRSGLNAASMFEVNLKSYILHNVDPESDCIAPATATKALSNAEFVLVMSPFVSDEMREYASVILPTAPFTETSGTLVNANGTWQRFSAANAPYAETRPAWKVLRVLGNLLDLDGYDYLSSEEVRAEVERESVDVKFDNSYEWVCTGGLGDEQGVIRISDVPMFGTDNIVRRAAALQKTKHVASESVSMNTATASQHGFASDELVVINQGDDHVATSVVIDERIPDNCASLDATSKAASNLGAPYHAVTITKD